MRQYEALVPHGNFADIALDEKTGIVLLNRMSFLGEQSALTSRIFSLHVKYDVCWIVLQELVDERISSAEELQFKQNYFAFHNLISSVHQLNITFKIKVVHSYSIQDTVDIVRNISLKSICWFESMDVSPIKPPKQVNQEEVFLASFQSLNPYVIHRMLAKHSLKQLLNSGLRELLKEFYTVPERFLKDFYSACHTPLSFPLPHEETIPSSVSSADKTTSESSPDDAFTLNPETSHLLHSQNRPLPYFTDNRLLQNPSLPYSTDSQLPQNPSMPYSTDSQLLQNPSVPYFTDSQLLKQPDKSLLLYNTTEKSLQELDLDYLSVKYDAEFDNQKTQSSEEDYLVTYSSPAGKKSSSSASSSSGFFRTSPMKKDDLYLPQSNAIPDEYACNNHTDYSQYLPRARKSSGASETSSSSVSSGDDFLANLQYLSLPPSQSVLPFKPTRRRNKNVGFKFPSQAPSRSCLKNGLADITNLKYRYEPNSNDISSFSYPSRMDGEMSSSQSLNLDLQKFMYVPSKRKLLDNDNLPPYKKTCAMKGVASQSVSQQDLLASQNHRRQQSISFPLQNGIQTIRSSPCYDNKMRTQYRESGNGFDEVEVSLQTLKENPLELESFFPMTPRTTKRLKYHKTSGRGGQTELVFE